MTDAADKALTAARWEQVRSAFEELIELVPDARAARLAEMMAADPDVARLAESLLAGDALADERLRALESALSPEALAPARDPFGLSGSTVSHFRVLEVLGAGGMGVVYRAEDIRLGRTVALKFLLPQYSIDPGAKARFLREAQATARLDHPNLCNVHESGETDDGHLFLAMSYYAGETLRARLARDTTIPEEQAVAIALQVARGLAYAHDAGVVHHDLKPANLILTPDGVVRILDFGLARARDLMTLTEPGVVMGTFAYMSPEQLFGDRSDARTDLWSLGAVLFEMLTGNPPPRGGTPVNAVPNVGAEGAPASQLSRVASEPVARVVEKLLQVDPARRHENAHALVADLTALQHSSPGASELAVAQSNAARKRVPVFVYAAVALIALLLGAASFLAFKRERDRNWLVVETVPRIEKYLDVADWESAYALARLAESRFPRSRELAELWPRISWRVTIQSEPVGAKVFRQEYGAADSVWEALGSTPLVDIRIPHGLSRIRLEMAGRQPLLRALGGGHLNWDELAATDPDALLVGPESYQLDTEQTLPANMVRVSGWNFADAGDTLAMRDFLLSRHEVTNVEYKAFVDSRGYRNASLWDTVRVKGSALPWAMAIARFVDRTGRPGPSTWEGGDYPDGEGEFPVSGVSWYEARAYARFVARELPTAHHWQRALANSMFPWLLPASNFSGKGARRVGGSRAMSQYGAFDMTGNVREWTSTSIGDARIILGGSWNDPYYIAGTNDTSAPPDDRSPGNGIRLARTDDEPVIAARARAPMTARITAAPGAHPAPVSDAIYAAYSRVFDYDRGPLDAAVERVDTTRVWIRERVRFNAGYGNEKMLLHLYRPTAGTGPYQTIVYFPGWDTFWLNDIDEYFAKQLDFIVKSGRAVAFPIYRGTFERRVDNRRTRAAFGTAEYRDNAIYTVKDLRRAVDYLETRADVKRDAIGFFGYSWGGVNGPVAVAQEPRIRAAVIQIGLLPPMTATPEVDPVNALPRIRIPLLMFSGEFDPMVPAENARHYFDLVGTPTPTKRHIIAVGGHFIPRDLLIRETLSWLDSHLGRVSR